MEASELDKNLGELEDKMERVRALYEQYFMGLEKLEPQIPRKEVDRRIVLLRKEQIRNTAMRFKFQTLVQRYNTLQQHWMRTMREIENGTYKRDLMKAAARFGVDEALTAMGKKHASRLKGVIDKQRAKAKPREELYEELSSSDLEFADELRAELGDALSDEDDAPTPPPKVYDLSEPADPGGAATAEIDPRDFDATQTGEELLQPSGVSNFGAEDSQKKALRHLFPKARGPKPRAFDITSDSPSAAPSFPIMDPLEALSPSANEASGGQESASVIPPSGGKKGGLRWGGSGPRRADPEALKRMASLAGVAGEVTAPPPEPEHRPRKPLLSSPLDLGIPDEPTIAPAPAPAPPREVARKPLLSSPIEIDLGLTPSEPPPPPPPPKPAPAPTAPPAAAGEPEEARRAQPVRLRPPEPASSPAARPAPAQSASAAAKADAAARREFGDLNDGRLREIYAQYVQARRDRNESTAGITFEKLSDSLKTQAEKLKGVHKKRVDYEVVVKDGKTLIKPIVK